MGSATSSMAAKLAFFPPDPPTYTLTPSERNIGRFIMNGVRSREGIDIIKVKTRKENEIVLMYMKNPNLDKKGSTLLYSHGNAADLGMMHDLIVELSVHLGVNLMAYDYSGYGQSSGKPSERNTYADIEAAYNCLIETYETRPEDIILYGQSLGSGPTIDLACRVSQLRGVILHSAILSGLRVIYPAKRTYWFDIYKNINKISHINFPVLVIHGTSDDIVDFSHGKKLWELCKHKYDPLWIDGGNHCNLELFSNYIPHLKRFITATEKSSTITTELNKSSVYFEPSRKSFTDSFESSRKSAEEQNRPSVYTKWNERCSLDLKLKPRKSVDRKDKPRKSVDRLEKVNQTKQHPEEKCELRVNRRSQCSFELYPEYVSELKKFITTIEKPSTDKTEFSESPISFEPARKSDADFLEFTRKRTEQHFMSNTNNEEMGRRSLDIEWKRGKSINKMASSRRSVDRKKKSTKTIEAVDQCEKGKTTKDSQSLVKSRNSIDRIGDMMRSVGLCNSGFPKKTASYDDQE